MNELLNLLHAQWAIRGSASWSAFRCCSSCSTSWRSRWRGPAILSPRRYGSSGPGWFRLVAVVLFSPLGRAPAGDESLGPADRDAVPGHRDRRHHRRRQQRGVRVGAAGSWQRKVPRLLRDLMRLLLVAIGLAIVYSFVWGREIEGALAALGVTSIVVGLALQEPLGNLVLRTHAADGAAVRGRRDH